MYQITLWSAYKVNARVRVPSDNNLDKICIQNGSATAVDNGYVFKGINGGNNVITRGEVVMAPTGTHKVASSGSSDFESSSGTTVGTATYRVYVSPSNLVCESNTTCNLQNSTAPTDCH